MKIGIFATGSRGDIIPYVALGQGLCKRGHHVRLVSFTDAAKWVEGTPIEFFPIAADFNRFMNSELGKNMMATQDNLVAHVRAISKFSEALSLSPGYWESYEKACDGMELIIYSVNAPQGFHLAERFKIPVVGATYLPVLTPTSAFASPMWPVDVHLGGAYNRFTHWVVEQFMWQPFRTMINQWRTQHLTLKPISWQGPFKAMRKSLILYGVSPSVIKKPDDWGDRVVVTGLWAMPGPTTWTPPDDLAEFLDAGEKPVYIGFGSMMDRNPAELALIAIEALKQTRQRGLLYLTKEQLGSIELPSTILRVDAIPFDWLFPKMAAVVHHGAAGTTALVLRAGVPSVVVPYYSDQPFWGRRLVELGVAPHAIPRSKLTAKNLAEALRLALKDGHMKARATQLSQKIHQEDGVKKAVDAIHRHLGWPL